MDHLVTPSSREAYLGPIVDEELGNIPHPSSRAGIPVPLSNVSELGLASGTLGNNPRDENAESITTVNGTSRALKSSFYRMASTSRESLDSFASMIFSPSSLSEPQKMDIHQLAQYLQSSISF